MSLKHIIISLGLTISAVTIMCSTAIAGSNVKSVGNVKPIEIVIDSDYIVAKVNDPVSRKDKTAYIVADNAEFHFISEYYSEAETIFYINEFVEGQDTGYSKRVLKKVVTMGEDLTMLPESTFQEAVDDDSAYRFTDHCYYIRVNYGPDNNSHEDFYFGLVDEETFERMAQKLSDSNNET